MKKAFLLILMMCFANKSYGMNPECKRKAMNVEQYDKLHEKLFHFSGDEKSIEDLQNFINQTKVSVLLVRDPGEKKDYDESKKYKSIEKDNCLGIEVYDFMRKHFLMQFTSEEIYHSDDHVELIDDDQKLVLAAKICKKSNGHMATGYAILKYNLDGTLDTTFNETGKCIEECNSVVVDRLLDMVVQPNGDILLWQKRSDGYCIDVVNAFGKLKIANLVFTKQ